ncbi:TetR/AcrR family transcriptional regulator [Blastococcus xanthinilyticus]|uniref:TetR family transcriptional regulator n=1 Tax=Blastococcus xanthinilyticus TaxID=1564164 RepID=A0A5S5D3F8_9ACTN|nr:TetR/AcrR family transcriptional regulator [Blastococcus xanthinilyticus]TYP89159.1 TetR family transcriptional regulator [Blastococcus xanthinilyticus]
MDDQQPELPDDVALLWGRRPESRRGRKPSLTLADLTEAAVRLADAEGLAAVSMARVAAELDASPMALYRYVASKDELLLLMSDAALEEPPATPLAGEWRERVAAWAREVLAAIRRHPWYRDIPISGPPAGPRNLAWLDRGLSAFAGLDIDEEDKVLVYLGVLPLIHGQVRLSIDLAAGFAEDPAAFGERYATALEVLVDPARMPHLARAVAAGVFAPGGQPDTEADADADAYDGFQAEFEFALGCYLDGVERYLAQRPATRPESGC